VPPPERMVRNHAKTKMRRASPSRKLHVKTWSLGIKGLQKQVLSDTLINPNRSKRQTSRTMEPRRTPHIMCVESRLLPTDLPLRPIGHHECITTHSSIIITWTPHSPRSFPLRRYGSTGSQALTIYTRFTCGGEETVDRTLVSKSPRSVRCLRYHPTFDHSTTSTTTIPQPHRHLQLHPPH
jgi:hypothetical protein